MKKVYIVREKAEYIEDDTRNFDNIVGVFDTKEAAEKRLTEKYDALRETVYGIEEETERVLCRNSDYAKVAVDEDGALSEVWSWSIEEQTLESGNDDDLVKKVKVVATVELNATVVDNSPMVSTDARNAEAVRWARFHLERALSAEKLTDAKIESIGAVIR